MNLAMRAHAVRARSAADNSETTPTNGNKAESEQTSSQHATHNLGVSVEKTQRSTATKNRNTSAPSSRTKQSKPQPLPLAEQLFDAASRGDVAGVKAALRAGADPRAVDEHGFTVLLRACESPKTGSGKIVGTLLEHGADPYQPTPAGTHPQDLATRNQPKLREEKLSLLQWATGHKVEERLSEDDQRGTDTPKSFEENGRTATEDETAADRLASVYETPLNKRADRILALSTPSDATEYLELLRCAVFGSEPIPLETQSRHAENIWGKMDKEYGQMQAVVQAWRQLSRRLFSAGRQKFAADSETLTAISQLEQKFTELSTPPDPFQFKAERTSARGDNNLTVACLHCGNTGEPVKRFNWLLFTVLVLFTSGIGGIIYAVYYVGRTPDRCPICGTKLQLPY